MSYNVGQFRRNQVTATEYSTKLSIGSYISSYDSPIADGLTVKNSAVALTVDGSPLKKNAIYHIRFKMGTYNMVPFRLVLANADKTKKMTIKRINPRASEVYEAIFMPNSADYNTLVFERVRANAGDSTGSVVPISSSNIELYELKDIMQSGMFPSDKLHQIGVQGPSGMLFSVNGEELRIGKSGIYELQGVTVSQLGFVVKKSASTPFADGYDYFILDYYY